MVTRQLQFSKGGIKLSKLAAFLVGGMTLTSSIFMPNEIPSQNDQLPEGVTILQSEPQIMKSAVVTKESAKEISLNFVKAKFASKNTSFSNITQSFFSRGGSDYINTSFTEKSLGKTIYYSVSVNLSSSKISYIQRRETTYKNNSRKSYTSEDEALKIAYGYLKRINPRELMLSNVKKISSSGGKSGEYIVVFSPEKSTTKNSIMLAISKDTGKVFFYQYTWF